MLRTNPFDSPLRFLGTVLAGFFLIAGFSLASAAPSHADLSVGIEDGAGTGGNPVTGNPPTTPSVPAPGGGGGGGGGGSSLPAGGFWVYTWGPNSICGSKPDAGPSIGYRTMWITEEKVTPSQDQPPAGAGWHFSSYFPGYGAYWNRTTPSPRMDCIFPPTYNLMNNECILDTSASFAEVRPQPQVLASRTASSGYAAGTPDPAACAASRTHVALNANIVRYSYVEGIAVSRAVTHTFKVYLEADPRTGSVPATEIVGTVGPYNLPAKRNSASLTCKGPRVPGDANERDFTENSCYSESSFSSSYKCYPSPILFDKRATWEWNEEMGTNPNNAITYNTSDFFIPKESGWSLLKRKDNAGRKITFNQNPSGPGITINSYSTLFERDATSTPFASVGGGDPLAEIDVFLSNGQKRIDQLQGSGLKTASYSGKANSVKLMLMGASSQNAPTKITQVLKWVGTRKVQTIRITGLNPVSGDIQYVLSTTDVPTSGECRSTASVESIRAIGDTIN